MLPGGEAGVRRTGTVFVLDARARGRIEPRNFFGESAGPGRGKDTGD